MSRPATRLTQLAPSSRLAPSLPLLRISHLPSPPLLPPTWSSRLFSSTHSSSSAKPPPTPSTSRPERASPTTPSTAPPDPQASLIQRGWAMAKAEGLHYWNGSKAMGKELRLSKELLERRRAGEMLTRREDLQLQRSKSDLLRLIPFSPFLIIPELLPFALKFFPNLLPSTFAKQSQLDANRTKLHETRVKVAKALQDAVRENAFADASKVKDSSEWQAFARKVGSGKDQPTIEESVSVSRLFSESLKLETVPVPQLISLCRYVPLGTFRMDSAHAAAIIDRLREIELDDQLIQSEGISSLTPAELGSACEARAIRTIGVDEERLLGQLAQWIVLHLEHEVSGSLLILSKALTMGGDGDKDDILRSLQVTLATLPDKLADLDLSSRRL